MQEQIRLFQVEGRRDARAVLRLIGIEGDEEAELQVLGSWVVHDPESDLSQSVKDKGGVLWLEGPRGRLASASLIGLAKLGGKVAAAVKSLHQGPPPLQLGSSFFDWSSPLIMGIVNVTPDSFSDGGRHGSAKKAIEHGLALAAQGAAILDVGGESTRPQGAAYGAGASSVSPEEECKRVLPVIEGLAAACSLPISIDTRKSQVAEAALKAGASLVNDVSGLLHDPDVAQVAAKYGAAMCLMHVPRDIEELEHEEESEDVLGDVLTGLRRAVQLAIRAGVSPERLIVDPGLGFGKSMAGNHFLLRHLESLRAMGHAVLVGASRKSAFARSAAGQDREIAPAPQRLSSSLATSTAAVLSGAQIVRVHDVKEAVEAARVAWAVRELLP